MRRKGGAHPRNGPHHALSDLAKRQHGVVSIRQLTGPLGYSSSAVDRAVRAGRLYRLYRGVFAVGHANISLHAQCLAAVLACSPHALLSHVSAAWLWDLTKASPLPASVCAPSHRTPRPPLRLHEARSLAPEDRALREGIPVTSLPRTLLDLAATVRFESLEKMVERSEDLELFDLRASSRRASRSDGRPPRPRAVAQSDRALQTFLLHPLDPRAPLPGALSRGPPSAATDQLRRPRVRARLLLARVPIRGRTRRLRDARDAGGFRARPLAAGGPAAPRNRNDPRDRAAAGPSDGGFGSS